MEIGQIKKVAKLNEDILVKEEEEVKVKVEGGDYRNDNEISGMDKLPNELMIKILDYFSDKQLIECRLLNSHWNEMCCLLLQDTPKNNPYPKRVVEVKRSHGENFLECKTVITKSFSDFLDCFAMMTEAEKKSNGPRPRPFPFSCFKLSDLLFMDEGQITRFASLFVHIKYIIFDIKRHDFENFGKLWRLLLKFAPNIEHLGILGEDWPMVNSFAPYLIFKLNSDPSQNPNDVNDDETFLNKLKVFESTAGKNGEIVWNPTRIFLEHAPNVQQLLYHDPLCLVELWQQLNRAHLLKKLEIWCSSKDNFPPPAELMTGLQLEKFRAVDLVYFNTAQEEKSAINYIYHALKSSQETLNCLELLELTMETFNLCLRDISSLQNVRKLWIEFSEYCSSMEIRNMFHRFSQLCPGVTSLNLGYIEFDFSFVAPVLWTGFQGLKFLKVEVQMWYGKNNKDILVLDSAFSGYSVESIQKIQAKLELDQGISLDEARAGETQQASILDLKDLSRLELKFWVGESGGATVEERANQFDNSLFIRMLPEHIRETRGSIGIMFC